MKVHCLVSTPAYFSGVLASSYILGLLITSAPAVALVWMRSFSRTSTAAALSYNIIIHRIRGQSWTPLQICFARQLVVLPRSQPRYYQASRAQPSLAQRSLTHA